MGAVGGGGEDLERMEALEAAASGVGGGKVERILVSVRLRPLNDKEVAANDQCDWECINDTTIIFRSNVPERSMPPTAYTFDRVFSPECPTMQVYKEGAKEVVLSVVSGINSTIFAYGQTSSGKTYTMSGITEYTVGDIYDYISRHEERAFVLKFSAIEIYNEAVKDLLSTDNTPLRLLDDPEKGTIVEKLTEETLRDWNHLKALICVCEAQRKIGETSLNETSSRSHQILRLTVESSAREFLGKDNSSTLVASVNFVDLAGSERASQALSAGTRLKEGCHINRSLLTLGTVIRKLSKGRNGHVPYRDSKLTRILQPSLGGNARTAIICTLSPARSHFEQSRNTLFFASCAKEVVTNAQVNVVMSDKALVKHLQKEVARLESELRYPGLSPDVEDLLREKDAQIKKMEKEIKELIKQRDIARSHLESLLQAVEVDGVSGQWEESSQISTPNAPFTCEDMLLTSEPSDVADRSVDSVSTKFTMLAKQHYLQMINKGIPIPKHSIRNPAFNMLAGDMSEKDVDQNLNGDYDDLCKEVRCIEMNEEGKSDELDPSFSQRGNNLLNVNTKPTEHREGQMNLGLSLNNGMTLEQHLHTVRHKFNTLLLDYPDVSSPGSSLQNISASRGLPLRRSRSCRSTLMSISSWLQEVEQNDSTPPSRDLKDFPGRPEGLQKKRLALNYDAETRKLSREGSQNSRNSTSSTAQKPSRSEVSSEGEITGIHDFVAELKQMAQVQYQEQLFAGQETDRNTNNTCGVVGTVKNVGLDLILDPLQSPSRWLQDFEQKQEEIIELWHACNVSLLHRTYFFVLFKGDPADSIYMEVELRRLSFLRNTLTRENLDKSAAVLQNTTTELSVKKLRREREMLCRQMQKRLSAEERESLYAKWGIALNSKQRKLQLVKRLWSETKNLEHLRESASLVARLIGIEGQGHALKEMFGLTFTPQESGRRFQSWKHGLSSRR